MITGTFTTCCDPSTCTCNLRAAAAESTIFVTASRCARWRPSRDT